MEEGLYEEAEVVAVLLRQLHQVGAEGGRGGLDELLEVDHLVVVHIRPAYDSIDLRVLQVREPKRLKSRPHLLLVQRAVTVCVRGLEELLQSDLAELRLVR